MQNQELNRQLQRIDNLIRRADEACGESIEMRSHWARYICILSAGLIENALKEIYTEFVRGAASRPVADYAVAQLSHLQNPNTTRLLAVVGSFKSDWRDELEGFVNAEGGKEAIDSIMALRHRIAHGDSFNVGISLVQVKEYLAKSLEVYLIEKSGG